jgi:hypothetical protein
MHFIAALQSPSVPCAREEDQEILRALGYVE